MARLRRLLLLFRLSSATGRRDQRSVVRNARELLELNPTDTLALGSVASAASELGNRTEAVEAWQSVVEIEPDHLRALQALAAHALDQGKDEEAYDYLKRAVAAFPEGPALPPRPLVTVMNLLSLLIARPGLGSRARRQAEAHWADQMRWKASAIKAIESYQETHEVRDPSGSIR